MRTLLLVLPSGSVKSKRGAHSVFVDDSFNTQLVVNSLISCFSPSLRFNIRLWFEKKNKKNKNNLTFCKMKRKSHEKYDLNKKMANINGQHYVL